MPYLASLNAALVNAPPQCGLDKYGRTIGDVALPGGLSLNEELVRQGMCWWYRKYAPGNVTLEKLETEARAARRGLWRKSNPMPPWEFRKTAVLER